MSESVDLDEGKPALPAVSSFPQRAEPRSRSFTLVFAVVASAALGASGGYIAKRPEPPETRFVNFDVESAPPEVLAEGWSTFETTPAGDGFVWCRQKACVLHFAVNAPSERVVRMRVFPFRYPGAPPQSVAVSVNGNAVASLSVPEGENVLTFGIDGKHLRQGSNRMRFEFAYAESPKDHVPGSTDERRLAVAFDWLEVVVR
jgi:hypothetical protein